MARSAHPIEIDGATIYIETVETTGPDGAPTPRDDLDYKQVSFFSDPLSDVSKAVAAITRDLKSSLDASAPSEFGIELNFSLKADVKLIPVLVNGSGEGAIKITVLWKNNSLGKPSDG